MRSLKVLSVLLALALSASLGGCASYVHEAIYGQSQEDVQEAWERPRAQHKTISEAVEVLAPKCKELHMAKKLSDKELLDCDDAMYKEVKPLLKRSLDAFDAADLQRNLARDEVDPNKKLSYVAVAVGYEGYAVPDLQKAMLALDRVQLIVNKGSGLPTPVPTAP